MSRTTNSNINSPYFMVDPVPVKSSNSSNKSINKHFNSNSSLFSDNDSDYFLKGDSSTVPTFEHKGGPEDIFVVHSNDSVFEVHRTNLKETLNDLKVYSHTQVRDLDSPTTESFKMVVDALKLLYTVPTLYSLVMSDIRSIFNNINNVIPGSVGAFFVGCFHHSSFPGPQGCNPICTASLPPLDPNYSTCDDMVLVYSDGSFSTLNNKNTSHAYIYINNSNFIGFTEENLLLLKDANIETCTLIFGNPDGSYSEIRSPQHISQLPLKNQIPTHVLKPNNTPLTPKSSLEPQHITPTRNTTVAVTFTVMIIIIVILLILMLYYFHKKNNAVKILT
jgi:hypothetical protein